MKELKGACIIGQSGGPTSVINASAYGVIDTALKSGVITHVLGAEHGIKGVLSDRLFDMGLEDPEELRLLKYTPSSALGSCRYKMKDPDEDDTDYKRILEVFKKHDVRYFFYNGGNDSMGSLSLYMPRETIAELFGDDNPSFPSVTALAAEGTDMDELCKTIESKVRSMKGISEDDEYDSVSANSMKSAIDALNSFMGAFSLITGAVAGISLLVGGIGIMNMMLTNVTERIREIGIRRALGASRRDITAQFLAESSALCVTGGLLGVLIGYLLAWGLTFFAANSGIMSEFGATGTITPSFSITTVLIAFAVSVGIGVIFGFYPARRAAKLDPVECLRYQ